jgi:hypothetical protein
MEASTRATLSEPVTPLGERRRVASAVSDRLDIGGKELPQLVDVAVAQHVEEPRREAVSFGAGGLKSWLTVIHVLPCPDRELAAGRLGSTDGRRDLGGVEPEHVPAGRTRPVPAG